METTGLIPPSSTFSLEVPGGKEQERIDVYLSCTFPLYSRSFFKRLIDDTYVAINGKTVHKPSTLVKPNDVVVVRFPPERTVEPTAVFNSTADVHVVHEHEHFLIVNKPAGLVVHQSSTRSTDATLVDWLVLTHNDIATVGYVDRPGIVHRLDKDTSGIMITARTNYAHTQFSDMFKNRTIEKTYHALVIGHPPKSGTIDFAIARHPCHRKKMTHFPKEHVNSRTSSPRIRHALTRYTVLNYFDEYTLVEFKPTTGRTHQIRVHFAAIGHPLVGDLLYGKKSPLIARQALHAHSLNFLFDGKSFCFKKEAPQDFAALLVE